MLHHKTWRSRKVPSRQKRGVVPPFKPYGILNKKHQLSLPARMLIFLFICGIAGVLFLGGMFLYYSLSLPPIAEIREGSIMIPESTKIYDRTGEHLLYTIHGEENRTRISLSDIPDYVKFATIATEDQDFYTRELAIDFKGLARAFLAMAKNLSVNEGPGGSTITQQLIKNMILTREKTFERKIKEIILAFRIEKTFTRDEILELYLNEIPYGSNAYGIEQAGQTFFGKSAKDLTRGQAAVLAALPKATTYYSPYGTHVDELLTRQKIILKQMLNEGYLTEEEWKAAQEEEIVFTQRLTNIEAPHFVMYVREILAHRYGETELEQGGLRVYTSLDYDLQKSAEKAVADGAKKNDAFGADNAALVAIDPKTGHILAMVGSRDYFDVDHKGNFNAALSPRQPGSSFKPVVYATLFTKGYTPTTILFDVETDFDPREGLEYKPRNFTLKEYGPVTIRKALAGSLNIPAVKALYLAGLYKVTDYAQKLGYTTLADPDSFGLSMALGGAEVKLLEHTAAFATFANDGVRRDVASILKVENTQGEVLEEFTSEKSPGVEVFSKNVSRMITDILSDRASGEYVFGVNPDLGLGNISVAQKTGTTNKFRDAWTLGYTPNLAAGVWVGRNDNQKMNSGMGGSRAAAPIWHAFMVEAVKGKEIVPFQKPQIKKTGKPILDGDIEGVVTIKIDTITRKRATDYTPEEYVQEASFADFHSILHYIDKDNPLGSPLADPSADPQYTGWENAIARWVSTSKEAAQFKKPPTEFDDVHVPSNIPYVRIISPQAAETITDDSVYVNIDTFSKRGVTRVEYFADGDFRESAGLTPFSRRVYFGSAQDGAHTLSVISYDDVGNRQKAEVSISLSRGITTVAKPLVSAQPSVKIISPKPGKQFVDADFPVKIMLELANVVLVKKVTVFYDDGQKNPMMIGSKTSGFSEELSFNWVTSPPQGTYSLYAVLVDTSGKSYRSEVMVTVKETEN